MLHLPFLLGRIEEIAAEYVMHLNLTDAWDDDLHEEISALLLQHKLLLFRGQVLDPETQLAMARKWGPVPPHPLGSREDAASAHNMPPGVVVLENIVHLACGDFHS